MSAERPQDHATHGFDFLTDPVLVVTPDGRLREANAAARAFFGSTLGASPLFDLVVDAGDDFARYLRLAAGATAPRPGRFCFAGAGAPVVWRTQAARSRQAGPDVQVILRLLPVTSDQFAVLDRRVKDLDAQLHKRLQENAALQEALAQNRTLLRELQHRVKNNIQLMMSLIGMAAKGHESPAVAAVVETSRGRLQAMASVQEALYQAHDVDTVPARSFLADVVQTAARANGAYEALSLTLADAKLSSDEAHCLALIANELITNAAKHGLRDGDGRIVVRFAEDGKHYRFEVEDDGPGIPDGAATRSSGLALVRGLCRQIGGRLEVGAGRGARCTVVFRPVRHEKETA